jgi:hypothetical protein
MIKWVEVIGSEPWQPSSSTNLLEKVGDDICHFTFSSPFVKFYDYYMGHCLYTENMLPSASFCGIFVNKLGKKHTLNYYWRVLHE